MKTQVPDSSSAISFRASLGAIYQSRTALPIILFLFWIQKYLHEFNMLKCSILSHSQMASTALGFSLIYTYWTVLSQNQGCRVSASTLKVPGQVSECHTHTYTHPSLSSSSAKYRSGHLKGTEGFIQWLEMLCILLRDWRMWYQPTFQKTDQWSILRLIQQFFSLSN